MTDTQILAGLKAKYPGPKWAGFAEIRGSTGYDTLNRLDFWAMNCYPSEGFLTVVAEIKVTRGDFLRELNNPKKRLFAESVSREAYFAAPTGLIKPNELPEGWGLIEVAEGGSARAKVRAKQRAEPEFTKGFIAAILRRGMEVEARLAKSEEHIRGIAEYKGDPGSFLFKIKQEIIDKERPGIIKSMAEQVRAENLEKLVGSGWGSLWVEVLNMLEAEELEALKVGSVRKNGHVAYEKEPDRNAVVAAVRLALDKARSGAVKSFDETNLRWAAESLKGQLDRLIKDIDRIKE